MAIWGEDVVPKELGFEEGRVLGDMFRRKQGGEVKGSATAGVRFRFNRHMETGSFLKLGVGDRIIYSFDRTEFIYFYEDVERTLRRTGLVLPPAIYDLFNVYFFDRMCEAQRIVFVDVLNLLKA
jgi:hypothetical protein